MTSKYPLRRLIITTTSNNKSSRKKPEPHTTKASKQATNSQNKLSSLHVLRPRDEPHGDDLIKYPCAKPSRSDPLVSQRLLTRPELCRSRTVTHHCLECENEPRKPWRHALREVACVSALGCRGRSGIRLRSCGCPQPSGGELF